MTKHCPPSTVRQLLPLCCCLLLASGSVLATMDPTNVPVNISGTVVANSSCTFSSHTPIQVDFGDVYIADIDSGVFRKPVKYTVTCKGDPDGKSIVMQLKGSEAKFDSNVLQTNVQGLGIKLLQNNTQIRPNDWLRINPALLLWRW
ncbi:putative minor fimbrial subunit StfF [Serratia fonticola]|uniref:fimbrial protein n=1 Tax=Serratia fonticola TaxID=47917 RepID=UPI00217B721B|nr:fimbrial protein [Serratia fonticola]CAI2045253.1 putative minor fimbrial subunit StfF [Serratia fonticola]